ncbi:MAG TPA: hypothetical protein VGO71_09010 [Baekduia sp.]|nr:hypothetical protein [Baekduia sp.]
MSGPAASSATRVAVVLDGPRPPAWQARALEGLRAATGVEVVAVCRVAGPRPSRAAQRRHALERRLFGIGAGADAVLPVEVPDAGDPGGATDLTVWLAGAAAPALPAGMRRLELVHGDGARPAVETFAFAAARGARTVVTEAWLRTGGSDDVVVARTTSGVRVFSPVVTATFALWKLAALVPVAVQRVAAGAAPEAAAPVPAPGPEPVSEPRLLATVLARWLRITLNRVLFRRPWAVRIRRHGPEPTRGWEDGGDVHPPWRRGHLYADPMLFERGGVHHLFVEDVPPGSPRGVISHVALDGDGRALGELEPVLEAAHHLSYPFVFAHGDEVFMIPETAAARRVELWRADPFPHAWRREAVLLEDVEAVDATVLEHDGRLWMFVGIAAPGSSTLDQLHLFWAADPRGPWTPHPRNPVVSDATCARPGGPVFRHDGELVRPGQDGSRRYGGGLSLRAIDVLSIEAYAEHEVGRIGPEDVRGGAHATHAYTVDGRFEAIDVRLRELRIARRLRGALRRS